MTDGFVTGNRVVEWLPVVNATTDVIPPNSFATPAGVDPTTGNLRVVLPTVDGDSRCVVTGDVPIPPGSTGLASYGMRATLAYEPQDGTPASGETWGPAAGFWKSRKNKAGWAILGGVLNGAVNAIRDFAGEYPGSSSSGAGGQGVRLVTEVQCDGGLAVDHGQVTGYVTIGGRRYYVTFTSTPSS